MTEEIRVPYWYFGGLACTAAASCTHPLDLLKVHMQTSANINNVEKADLHTKVLPNRGMIGTGNYLLRTQGITSLYAGLSACWLKQLTYSTARFSIYEILKQKIQVDGKTNLTQKLVCSAIAGGTGGIIGAPADLVNIRMQNDMKLPIENRRNYKNALEGVFRIARQEGVLSLFNGATMASIRSVLLSVGQLCMYDQIKGLLLEHSNGLLKDNLITHFSASLIAGGIATTITHPLDVIKVRLMNAPPSNSRRVIPVITGIVQEAGLYGFLKGYVPAFIRLGPQTILTFVFFEQLRLNFGYIKEKS